MPIIAVGVNHIITSKDHGVTWVEQTPFDSTTLNGVCWAPTLQMDGTAGLYVAVGEGGKVFLSRTGVSWEESNPTPYNYDLNDVCWSPELELFVAVGDPGTFKSYIITSPDGVDWTVRAATNYWSLLGVIWNGSIFVAVGSQVGANAYILTSTNGLSWTFRVNAFNNWLKGIAWSGTRFVATGANIGAPGAHIQTSYDGITWQGPVTNPKNKALVGIAHNGTIFCAVGGTIDGDAYIVTSLTGDSWAERANPANVSLQDIIWTGTQFVAVGASSGTDTYIITSPNGIDWTERDAPQDITLNSICFGGPSGDMQPYTMHHIDKNLRG